MGKYLHRYHNESDFQKDYNGKGEVTAITVNSALLCQSCDDWDNMVETHDYDGTYVFDREEEITNPTTCDGSPSWFSKVRVFKNGNKEIYCEYDTEMNIWSYELDGPWVSIYQDFSHLFQAGDGYSENFTLEYSEGVYHEPWVSYTTDKCVSKFEGQWAFGDRTPFTMEYVGECDFYTGMF